MITEGTTTQDLIATFVHARSLGRVSFDEGCTVLDAIELFDRRAAGKLGTCKQYKLLPQPCSQISEDFMRVYTLWHEGDAGEVPWIIDAVDQYTVNNNCEFPPPYLKHRADIHVMELIIDVPEDAVRALFSAPSVRATVIKDDQRAGQSSGTCTE